MKVRMLVDVAGGIFNDPNDVRRGQVIDTPTEQDALRMMHFKQAEPPDAANESPQEHKARVDRCREAYLAHAVPMLEEARAIYKPRGAPEATVPDNKRWAIWR